MGIAFPQCLWGIPEMTAVPATIVGMLQYKRPSTDEKSQSNPSERETLLLQIQTSRKLIFAWLPALG